MALANITPVGNIPPFKETENENFNEFEQQLVSSIGVATIQDADRHLYLHLHLKGGALASYDQLPPSTRQDLDASIASLRQRYVNPHSRVSAYCLQSTEIQAILRNSPRLTHRPSTHWSTVVPRRWSTTNCWWQTWSRRRKATFRRNSKSARSLHKWVAKQDQTLSLESGWYIASGRTLRKNGLTPCSWTTLSSR